MKNTMIYLSYLWRKFDRENLTVPGKVYVGYGSRVIL